MKWRSVFIRSPGAKRRAGLVEALTQQATLARQVAGHVREVCVEGGRVDDLLKQIQAHRHNAVEARETVTGQLSRVLVTPIDREDMYRVARSVQEVLSNLHDLAVEFGLYPVADLARFVDALDAIVEALDRLELSLELLAVSLPRAMSTARDAEAAADQVRRRYQLGVANLLSGSVDVALLAERECFRRVDVIGLRLSEAANVLIDGIVKRSV